MACSNFCTLDNLDQVRYSLGYVSRAELRAEQQRMEKARAMYEVHVAASTAGADPVHGSMEQQIAAGGASIVTATLALAVVSAALSAPFMGLIEAISTTIAAHQASNIDLPKSR